MTDHPTEDQLALYSEGKASDAERVEIERHLVVCSQCAVAFSITRDLRDVGPLLAASALSPSQVDKFRRAILPSTPRTNDGREGAATAGAGSVGLLGMGIASLIYAIRPAFHGPLIPSFAARNAGNLGSGVRSEDPGHSVGGERSVAGDDLANDNTHHHGAHSMSHEFTEPEKVHGTPPDASSAEIQQRYQDTCAVRSQEIVLRDFGVHVSEDQLRAEAMANGWYAPDGGTPAAAVGNLLELHGVGVNRFENANIFNLQNELAQGHRVIVGVDSGELWNAGFMEKLEDKVGMSGADHALVVSSIDTTDPDHVKVVLTDPGTGQVAAVYTQEQFQNAWKDSNCLMIATTEAAPAGAPGMENFDYAQGHVNNVGEMPYGLFSHYMDYMAGGMDPEQLSHVAEIYSAAIQDYSSLLAQLDLADAGLSMHGGFGNYDDLAARMLSMADLTPGPLPEPAPDPMPDPYVVVDPHPEPEPLPDIDHTDDGDVAADDHV